MTAKLSFHSNIGFTDCGTTYPLLPLGIVFNSVSLFVLGFEWTSSSTGFVVEISLQERTLEPRLLRMLSELRLIKILEERTNEKCIAVACSPFDGQR